VTYLDNKVLHCIWTQASSSANNNIIIFYPRYSVPEGA